MKTKDIEVIEEEEVEQESGNGQKPVDTDTPIEEIPQEEILPVRKASVTNSIMTTVIIIAMGSMFVAALSIVVINSVQPGSSGGLMILILVMGIIMAYGGSLAIQTANNHRFALRKIECEFCTESGQSYKEHHDFEGKEIKVTSSRMKDREFEYFIRKDACYDSWYYSPMSFFRFQWAPIKKIYFIENNPEPQIRRSSVPFHTAAIVKSIRKEHVTELMMKASDYIMELEKRLEALGEKLTMTPVYLSIIISVIGVAVLGYLLYQSRQDISHIQLDINVIKAALGVK